MTEERFKELFGENDELYIKLSDLKKILVDPRDDLVYDFIVSRKDDIWEGKNKTSGTILKAMHTVFGNGWEEKIRFQDLIRDFKKLTYRKGLGIVALGYIVKMCKISGNKITSEMIMYDVV